MHDTTVKMKDGRTFCGVVWVFRPAEGFLTIPMETDEKLYFRDMESAVTRGGRANAAAVGDDIDLLARARKEGWDGT